AEVADQLADAGRVDVVDLREVDDHVSLVVGEGALQGPGAQLGALAQLDHALHVQQREASDVALFDDHQPIESSMLRGGYRTIEIPLYFAASHGSTGARSSREALNVAQQQLTAALERGIDLCRKGDWVRGMRYLKWVAESEERSSRPGLFYSFLGYGIALHDQRYQEAVKLCEFSIKVEFYQPDHYWNLARTHLLADDRRKAVQAVRKGLAIDSHHPELLVLARQMGIRRSPVLPFLSRNNLLNRFLGRLRHLFTGKGKPAASPAPPSPSSPSGSR